MSDSPSDFFYSCNNADMSEVSESTNSVIALNDTEIDRLVKFFDVLIEMDFENKRNEKNGGNRNESH